MNKTYAVAIAVAAVVVVALIVAIPQLGGDDANETASTPLDQTGQAPPISDDATLPADHPDINGAGAEAQPGSEEAVKAAEAALEANPDDPQLVLDLADAYVSAGRTDDAVKVVEDALAANPDDVTLRQGLAMIDLNQGNYKDAEAALVALTTEDPKNQEATYDLAIVYWSSDQRDKALATWQKVVDLDPTSEFGQMASQFVTMMNSSGSGSSSSPHGSGGAAPSTTTTTG